MTATKGCITEFHQNHLFWNVSFLLKHIKSNSILFQFSLRELYAHALYLVLESGRTQFKTNCHLDLICWGYNHDIAFACNKVASNHKIKTTVKKGNT